MSFKITPRLKNVKYIKLDQIQCITMNVQAWGFNYRYVTHYTHVLAQPCGPRDVSRPDLPDGHRPNQVGLDLGPGQGALLIDHGSVRQQAIVHDLYKRRTRSN